MMSRIVTGDELHQEYAPIMHFWRRERLFMSVDDECG
jgi:hypothetical protein